MRIVQLTDFHLYTDPRRVKNGVNPELTLRSVLDHIVGNELDARLLLATGDLVHDASPEGYTRLLAHFRDTGRTVYCLPGNHDLPAVMAETLTGAGVQCLGHALIGNWCVVLLNSVVAGKEDGHLAQAELERLDLTLRRHADRHVLVSLHHQPVAVGTPGMDAMGLDNPDELFRVVDAHSRVRGVVWGHIHHPYEGYRGALRLLGSPSTCYQFVRGAMECRVDPAAGPGYLWLELAPDGQLDTGVTWVAPTSAGAG